MFDILITWPISNDLSLEVKLQNALAPAEVWSSRIVKQVAQISKLISVAWYRTIEVHEVSSQEMAMIPFGNSKVLVNYANVSYFTQNVFKFRRFV